MKCTMHQKWEIGVRPQLNEINWGLTPISVTPISASLVWGV